MKEVEVIKASNSMANRVFSRVIDRMRVAPYCRVSTDSEDQINSYKSQVKYYTDYVNSKEDWVLVDVYADEAITGTQTKKREGFQRLINDCMNGDIDMIITKSISRFARNTLDTLKYVRMLKAKNIAVFFEEENINTLTMDGELLLVILSSVAQQEVENISANVKKGLKMKMQRGELIGFQGCLGYDYHSDTKTITVNEEEAEIVRYIFDRYVEGAGCGVIGRELENKGYKTKRGSNTWADSTVMGILKNEKYIGDIRQGKTFTVDPISKRRLENFGEEDQFYIKNNHEPIISQEIFASAQAIIKRRGYNRKGYDGKREKYSRKYAFSSLLECGFCGSHLSRRSWHAGSQYHKTIWQCITNTKKGKKFCPDAKGISETTIEQAFLESYKLLCYNNKDIMDELLNRIENTLCSTDSSKEIARIDKAIKIIEHKRKKLLDMRLDETIDREAYEDKYYDLLVQLEKLNDEKASYENTADRENNIKKRLADFKKVLSQNETLTEFDRTVFESIVDKVIVGGYDDDGNKDPSMLTFVYKTGFTNTVDANKHKPERKNSKDKSKNKLCFFAENDVKNLCSDNSADTYRNCGSICRNIENKSEEFMNRTCAIISGGEFSSLRGIENADFIIACDKGYEYAKSQNITPDLIIGDFDSLSGSLPSEIEKITLPCEKDETDTMAAIVYAIDMGFDKILLSCALGGRLDHLLGNLQAAAYAAKSGITVKIFDEDNEIYVFSNSKITLKKRENFSISVIALTDKCENVTISGGKYTLKNATLTNTSTLGISNEWQGDITVSAGRGVLAVVMSKTK